MCKQLRKEDIPTHCSNCGHVIKNHKVFPYVRNDKLIHAECKICDCAGPLSVE